MSKKRKTPAEQAERLRSLILAGNSTKQTAALMGMKPSSLYAYASRLRSAGFSVPSFKEGQRVRSEKNKKRILNKTVRDKLAILKKYRPENAGTESTRYMTDGEIRQSVRLAADPVSQIRILAELNGMKEKEVRAIVKDMLLGKERIKNDTDTN